jgi:DNA-binding transcriptional LysR family regulator
VTVATYASFASLWLVPRLAAFQKAHPEIEIRIDAADRLVDLEAEEIDMAIRWLRPGSSVDPSALLLGEEEVAPALSPRLLESSGVVLNVSEAADAFRVSLLPDRQSAPRPPAACRDVPRVDRRGVQARAAPAHVSGLRIADRGLRAIRTAQSAIRTAQSG